MRNTYAYLDVETQNFIRENENYNFILNCASTLFKWSLKSNSIKIYEEVKNQIEIMLLTSGEIAFYIDNNILKVGLPSYVGNLNFLGIPQDIQIIEPDGKTHFFKNYLENKDICIVKNNYLSSKSTELMRYSHMKAEIDLSIVHNVVNSRYTPMIVVSSQNQKSIVDKAIENNKNGKPSTIVVSNPTQSKPCEVMNITDVNASKNIENLSLIQETLSKRLLTMYGCNVNSGFKKAQQSVDEIIDGQNSSFIYTENALTCRKAEYIKEWFIQHNIEMTVELGDCWKTPWKQMVNDNDNGNDNDNANDNDNGNENEVKENDD